MSSIDERLVQIIAASPVNTMDDVVAVMRALDGALSSEDGLKWFNLLYLKVTEHVRSSPPAAVWEDPQWLERLDVVFSKLYFDAIVDWQSNREDVARAWAPLFASRPRRDIMRVQFALAGMNAHINHDLSIALVQTDKEQGLVPRRGSPQHRDFERINSVLEIVQEEVKQYLATGIVGEIDQDLGRIDDTIATWKIRKARETAWINAEILWQLNSLSITSASRDFLLNLDRLVGLGTRGLLIPVGLE